MALHCFTIGPSLLLARLPTACGVRGRPKNGAARSARRRDGRAFENELQDGSIGRILYTRLPWRTIIPLRGPLLGRCSHLPACSDGAALRSPKAARMPI